MKEMFQHLSIAIILVFTLIPLVIGSFAFKNSLSTVSDFFLCNRSMGTTISFFTVYATWWSSFAFLGSISYFYSIGAVYWTSIGWNVLFGLLFMLYGLKLSSYAKNRNYITPINFFSDIYRSPTLNIIVTFIMTAFALLHLQIQLFGGALIIEIATKGLIPWQLCAFIFYLVMIIYLWAGGLRAVAWTDIFYGILTFCGMLACGLVLTTYAGGVHHVFQTICDRRPNLILLSPDDPNGGISMWISMFLLVPLGELMSAPMWIRIYAVKEKKTFHIMPFLLSIAAIAYLGSMLAGNAANVLKPVTGPQTSDTILPYMLVQYAPSWIMAIILCCGTAACLSTANSNLHAISALFSLDIYKKYVHPRATEGQVVNVAKFVIVAFSAVTYLLLAFYKSPESIVATGFTALSVSAQLIVPVTGALFWQKSHPIGAILGLLAGISFTLIFSSSAILLPIHSGIIGLCLNTVIFLLCGILLPKCPATASKIASMKRNAFDVKSEDHHA